MKQKLINMANERTSLLEQAETALNAGNHDLYNSTMERVQNLNGEIQNVQQLLQERDRKFLTTPPDAQTVADAAAERGNALQQGREITFTVDEVRRAVCNSTTLSATTLVQPTGSGSEIRDLIGSQPSSIVDQVYVQDLTGLGGYMEPYVVSELAAKDGKPATLAGTARTESTDPVFGYAQINPWEVNLTSYVDRNISRLSPANYFAKIQSMAMSAMRRKFATLIVNGDGQGAPVLYGIKNAKNKAGDKIYAETDVSAIDENLLDTLFFAYGSDDSIGPNAQLYLTKADLKAIGHLRNQDKRRVFKIRPAAGNPNIGTIEDDGVVVPYTIVPDLTPLAGTKPNASNSTPTMLYGDPQNYELALFGDLTIRVDESCKAPERMLTILGDAMVGGNLICHRGFVVANLPKQGV